MIQELVGGASNLLVANMCWMVTSKTHVYHVSLFEERQNRRNSGIWKTFLSLIFSQKL